MATVQVDIRAGGRCGRRLLRLEEGEASDATDLRRPQEEGGDTGLRLGRSEPHKPPDAGTV